MITALSTSGATNLLDSNVITFIVDGAEDVIGLMISSPLGIFISLSVATLVVRTAIRIMKAVRR